MPKIIDANLTFENTKDVYDSYSDEGKLLNEIYDFLNQRAVLLTPQQSE